MQNILANAHNNTLDSSPEQGQDIKVSERDFLLQRNIHKLKEVGRLRVKTATLISGSGDELTTRVSLPQRSPSSSNASTSPPYYFDTNDKDSFSVDLRKLSMSSSAPAVPLSAFIDSGGQIEFCVAIDFTSSNGK